MIIMITMITGFYFSVAHWDENSFGLWKLKVNDTEAGTAGNLE